MLTTTPPTSGSTGTVTDLVRAAARAFPDTAVVVDSHSRPDTFTLSELYSDAQRLAAGLMGCGVEVGDTVAVQLPNGRECFAAHAAVWMAGAVLLPIVPIYGPREVQSLVRRSGARVFITADTFGSRDSTATLAAVDELRSVAQRVVVGQAPRTAIPYVSLLAPSASDFTAPNTVRSENHCLLVYTSGTTAEPKGVRHNHVSLLAEINSVDLMRPASEPMTALSVFPSGHIAGVLNILRMLTVPSATVVMDAWKAETAALLIAKHQVAMSAGAPIHLQQILDAADRDHLDLSSLREYTTGAASVAATLIRRADRRGIRAYRCYGSTEHPTISAGGPDDSLDHRADTDGRLTPGTQVRVVDDDGHDVSPGHDGEILTRGPELFIGYDDVRHECDAHFEGWFRSGDVGHIDADGFLTITDRKKDIIIRGGEKISSREVEDVLGCHPDVIEAAAVGAPDEVYGERVCAFVVLRPGCQLTAQDAAQYFRESGLAAAKSPQTVVAVDELPRTAGGKVQKHRLRERLTQPAGKQSR